MPKGDLVSNVMNQLSVKLNSTAVESRNKNNVMVALNGSNINLESKLENIYLKFSKDYDFILAYSFMASRILDKGKINTYLRPKQSFEEEAIFDLDRHLDLFDVLICPNLTVNTLSKVVLGTIDTYLSNLIWASLYLGKKVYIDFDNCRNYLNIATTNKAIQNQLDKKINEILSMGANEIVYPYYDFYDIKENYSKMVITEKDIDKLKDNHSLHLPYGSIVTPLARDKAKDKNINIVIDVEAKNEFR